MEAHFGGKEQKCLTTYKKDNCMNQSFQRLNCYGEIETSTKIDTVSDLRRILESDTDAISGRNVETFLLYTQVNCQVARSSIF